MSKAFTRESDDEVETAPLPMVSRLSAGVKNYMTPTGAKALREEAENLREQRRRLLAEGPDEAHRGKLREWANRIRVIEESLSTAEVVPVPSGEMDEVRFGATVEMRTGQGAVMERYRIVGIDEADFDRGWISWLSPLAKALLGARKGSRVRFQVPAGEEEIEIL